MKQEEKTNIADILKDCPSGMELDCVMYDNLYFNCIREHPIYPITCWTVDSKGDIHDISFNWYGKSSSVDTAKCVIFPKGKTTWEGFQRPFKDGEVVVYEHPDRKDLQIFIFKCKKENNTLSECYLMLDGNVLDLECGMYYVTRLATEEEKQKLFDAIKANGYKWNAETTTLEKLIEPKFKVGDKIKNKNSGICDKVIKIFEDCYLVESCLDGQATIDFDIQDNWELVHDKFDITTLKPFDKVLTRANDNDTWVCNLYSHALGKYYVVLNAELNNQCIPFNDETKHLVGTTDDCDEYYKTWEE